MLELKKLNDEFKERVKEIADKLQDAAYQVEFTDRVKLALESDDKDVVICAYIWILDDFLRRFEDEIYELIDVASDTVIRYVGEVKDKEKISRIRKACEEFKKRWENVEFSDERASEIWTKFNEIYGDIFQEKRERKSKRKIVAFLKRIAKLRIKRKSKKR